MGSSETGHARRHWVALALFTGLSLLLTYPLVIHFATAVLGPPQDNYYYLSWFSWFRHSLLDLRAPSTFNPHVFYPFGHDFATSETTWTHIALTLPVLLLWGEVPAYNLAVLLSFILSGFGMYLLVLYITRDRLAAIVSGAIYAFCPYRMAHLGGGQLPLLGTQWLPLCLWAIERLLREKRWIYGLWTGLFYGLAALSSWYYAFMTGLLLPIYLVLRARPWRLYPRARYVWAALLSCVLLASAIVTPALLPTLRLSGKESMSYSLQWVDRWSASIADYLLPNVMHPLWGGVTTRFYSGQWYFYERILAVGFLPIILAGIALCKRSEIADPANRQMLSAVLWLGCIALILSLGTSLHWRDVDPVHIPVPGGLDQLFTRVMFNWITRFSLNPSAYHWGYQAAGHIVLPLPALLLYLYLPFSNAMRVWSRFGLFVILAVAILAGSGLAAILRQIRRRQTKWSAPALGIVCLLLVIVEYAAIPFPYGVSQVSAQPATEWLRTQPDDVVVMELPLTRALNGPPLYAARWHGKRIAYGYGTFYPDEWMAQWSNLGRFPASEALTVLRQWGVRYVLVASLNYGDAWPDIAARIAARSDLRLLGIFPEKPLYKGDRWFVSTRESALPFLADNIYVYELLDR